MELFSRSFTQTVKDILKHPKTTVLATVPLKANPFVEDIKHREGVILYTVCMSFQFTFVIKKISKFKNGKLDKISIQIWKTKQISSKWQHIKYHFCYVRSLCPTKTKPLMDLSYTIYQLALEKNDFGISSLLYFKISFLLKNCKAVLLDMFTTGNTTILIYTVSWIHIFTFTILLEN